MSDATAEDWLPEAWHGEPAALDGLVRRLRPAVYRYCRTRLPDRETAEDVTQEVMIAMIDALQRRRATGHSLRAYVFGIATNKIAMAHRTAYRRREILTDEPPEGQARTAGPAQVAEDRETVGEINALLGELPENYRSVILLRDMEELSTLETAQTLDLTEDVVKTRLHRARLAIRQKLDEYMRTDGNLPSSPTRGK